VSDLDLKSREVERTFNNLQKLNFQIDQRFLVKLFCMKNKAAAWALLL